MCIAGFISLNKDRLYIENQIKMMLSSLSHRGPDNEDYYIDESCGLAIGHRRLSIIDLSKNGSQPMYSYNRNYLLSFNGEIYNHLDLRKDLKMILILIFGEVLLIVKLLLIIYLFMVLKKH